MRRLALLLVVTGCSGAASHGAVDAGPTPVDAAPIVDAAAPVDSNAPLTWVDFAIAGCASYDATGPRCDGTAPLTLRFTPVTPAPVDSAIWTFGDGSDEVTALAPAHTFARPGVYDVSLTVGGPGGTATVVHAGVVVASSAPLGASCASSDSCAEGLSCLCGDGTSCPPSLSAGLCTAECGVGQGCPTGGVCADLSSRGDAAWRRPLCLASCTSDADCGAWRCRELPDGGGGGWVHACFPPDVLLDDGASCDDASGAPDPSRCASGSCLPIGARGLCATPCFDDDDRPSYATCAALSSGGSYCLARCAADHPCDADPWLACAPPDPSGGLGFTVGDPPASAGYCAARRCTSDGDCPDGACLVDGGASFCGPR